MRNNSLIEIGDLARINSITTPFYPNYEDIRKNTITSL